MMRAMMLEQAGHPLQLKEVPVPVPAEYEVLVKVHACGVCRTDLHIADGELTASGRPLVLGHEIVGTVAAAGKNAGRFTLGQRVGIPWLGCTCGHCRNCRTGRENLCDYASFTGYTRNGGFADYVTAHEDYCLTIPAHYGDAEAAPLLCAGLIGYRALKAAGDAAKIGIYGFGAAAHIIAQVAHWQGREIYAFTRPGDVEAQAFATRLGAAWAGDSTRPPPEELDAALLFAPVGALIPEALRHTAKGGTVVCAGIHMSDIPEFPYSILWGERSVRSIANLTRRDGEEFMDIAAKVNIRTHTTAFPLSLANEALESLREGRIQGAAVLVTEPSPVVS
jgi:alcohol dehydrogenase, propanol-preferring